MIEYSIQEKLLLTKVPKVFNYQILNKQILLFTGLGNNDIVKFIDILKNKKYIEIDLEIASKHDSIYIIFRHEASHFYLCVTILVDCWCEN